MNIIRIALIAPQEKDRQQLREQMFSYAVRWKVAVVTDCFDCLEEFAMAAQSGGYQLVCLRGGERQWRAAEELRRIRGEGETLWAYLEEGQALRAKVLTAADTFGTVEWRRVSGMNTVMTDYFALAPRHARDAILPLSTRSVPMISTTFRRRSRPCCSTPPTTASGPGWAFRPWPCCWTASPSF